MYTKEQLSIINNSSNPKKLRRQLTNIKTSCLKHNVIFDIDKILETREYFLTNKFTPTKDNYILRYGTEVGLIMFESFKNKSKQTLENFQKSYPNDWEVRWEEFKNKSKQTLENFIIRYGEVLGKEKYKIYSKKCANSSLEYYIKKYGEEIGKIKFNERCLKSSLNSKNNNSRWLEKYNIIISTTDYKKSLEKERNKELLTELEARAVHRYYSSLNSKNYPSNKEELLEFLEDKIYLERFNANNLNNEIISKCKMFLIKLIYNNNISLLLNDIIDRNSALLSNTIIKQQHSSNNNSYISYTDSGVILRSSDEILFYKMCKYYDLRISVNKKYPDSNFYYDFYIHDVDEYIEIVSMNDEKYLQKIKMKQKLFNSVVIKREDIEEYFKNLKLRLEEKEMQKYENN